MSDKPKKIEIDQTTENNLRSAMFLLMRLFPHDAEREVYNQKNKKRRENKEQKPCEVW